MSERKPNLLVRLLRGLWDTLNFTRRLVLNLVVLFVLVVVLVAIFSSSPTLQQRSTLWLAPQGNIVEQFSISPMQRALAQAQGSDIPETRLRDLLKALETAATDDRIERVALRTDGIQSVGFAALRDIAEALGKVRAAGKQVLAYADSMDQRQYYLAAQADEVYLHPDGMLWLEGLSAYRSYYREALEDKLGLDVHLFRVGEFKNAAEPFILDAPSEETLAASRYMLDDIWQRWLADIAAARQIDAAELHQRIDDSARELAADGGDFAATAKRWGLIDGTLNEDEFDDLLRERGALDDNDELVATDLDGYLRFIDIVPAALDQRPQIAVVVAQGEILDGEQPAGVVGGPTVAALVREAREDEKVKAVVLRVDSPGGSAFASEQIRREIELTRAAGKPVIASMGNLAASGGYWISMDADEIWADPSTLTGSIGVFGLFFTASQTLDKLGVHVGGVGTTRIAGAMDPRRPLDSDVGQIIQSLIDKAYHDFIGKVAHARDTEPSAIDAVARGRVWTGAQALERGLVDSLGSFEDAIAAAAARVDLASGDYRVRYVEQEPSAFERFVDGMSANAATRHAMAWALAGRSPLGALPLDAATRAQLLRELPWLTAPTPGKQPIRTVVHCFCSL
ncbi:MAG: signal peptide peptidase SppA [Lysobacteraceae bacterium]